MNIIIGSVGMAKEFGALSPVYYVLKPRNDSVYMPFYNYVFQSKSFQRSLVRIGYGILAHRMRIPFIELKKQHLPKPPLTEQQAVADFLDRKTAQIDTFVEKKQRQINLLYEQHTALINHAVTRGLNSNTPMKDSGLEWVKVIPKNWETVQIKRIFLSSDYGVSSSLEDNGKFAILTMGDIQNGEIVIQSGRYLDEVPEELILEKDDILFNRTNSKDLVAKVGIFRGNKSDNVSFASYLVRFKVNEKVLPEYANYLMNCSMFIEWARSHALPSINQSNLNPTRYSQLSVCLPPVGEQDEIIKHLNTESKTINGLVTDLQKEIDFAQEYRISLVSEAVTGKIDVRTAV